MNIKKIVGAFGLLFLVSCSGSTHEAPPTLYRVEAPKQGLDVLALAKINPLMLSQELDYNSALGVLLDAFGNAYPNLKVVLDSGKVTDLRAHYRNGTCFRNNVCPTGFPPATDTRSVREAARRFASFGKGYPHIRRFCSPSVEHDVTNQEVVKKWFQIIKEEDPTCIPVCSAFRGWCPSNVLIEKHGNFGSADIRSNDGSSLFDSDSVKYRTSGKVLTLGWIPEFNGRVSGEKQFVPISQRVNYAGRALIRQVVRLMRPPQARPITSCNFILSPNLFKTNAESYGKGLDDGRGNKGLFIVGRKYSRISVQTTKGKEVGCLRYYGPFDGGGYRHYIGSCSGETPVGLMDELASEWGILKVEGKCWLFNAIRRLGYYR